MLWYVFCCLDSDLFIRCSSLKTGPCQINLQLLKCVNLGVPTGYSNTIRIRQLFSAHVIQNVGFNLNIQGKT